MFADIIIPLSVSGTFTYYVPDSLIEEIAPGKRVIVQFSAARFYTGLVTRLHNQDPGYTKIKPVELVLDPFPLVNPLQLEFWQWIGAYYHATPGEVMVAGLPAGMRFSSETVFSLSSKDLPTERFFSDDEFLILEAFRNHEQVAFHELKKILAGNRTGSVVRKLVDDGILQAREDLEDTVKQRSAEFLMIHTDYKNQDALKVLTDSWQGVKNKERSMEVLLRFLQESKYFSKEPVAVQRSIFLKNHEKDAAIVQRFVKSGILCQEKRPVSFFQARPDTRGLFTLSAAQASCLQEIKDKFKLNKPVLLSGVPASGKSELYFHLIRSTLDAGLQVLFLAPELSINAQMQDRISEVFAEEVAIISNRNNPHALAEAWTSMAAIVAGKQSETTKSERAFSLIVGTRHALFLPFCKLGLIIVDEEHDPGYKQQEPSPRFHARDAAIKLAGMHGCSILLGSQTPSLESWYNAERNKYSRVNLSERFSGNTSPVIELFNMRSLHPDEQERPFGPALVHEIKNSLEAKGQVILFQNRRGFSAHQRCDNCSHIPQCKSCDVSLTYHKSGNHLRCHYCSYSIPVLKTCPQCGSGTVRLRGIGTQRVEEDAELIFPSARIARMDFDSTASRKHLQTIMSRFDEGEIDILIGTRMVARGLDFRNVRLVGVINADNLFNFPDFRSYERAFQQLSQLCGRSGRGVEGKVLIQTLNPDHPVLQRILYQQQEEFMRGELEKRRLFGFPPFKRLILIRARSKDQHRLAEACWFLASRLRQDFPDSVLGPEEPLIPRVNNYYRKEIWMKVDEPENWRKIRIFLQRQIDDTKLLLSKGSVQWVLDADPV